MDYQDWLANWQREADRLFRLYESLPPELQPSIQQLHLWGGEARLAAEKVAHLRLQLRQWRLDRQAAEKRIEAIAKKQSLQTEMEIAEREYQRWKQRLDRIKADIERVTGHIILTMRQRAQERLEQQSRQDEKIRAQLQADLDLWDSFKIHLQDEPNPNVDELIRQREERARLRREYQAYQQRSAPSSTEDQDAWAEFTQNLKKKGNS